MSIKIMSAIFGPHVPVSGASQVLLLKLADMANDDGWCWPAVATLATACRRSERQTQRMLNQLAALGLLVMENKAGPRQCNRYRVIVPDSSMCHVAHGGDMDVTTTQPLKHNQKVSKSGDAHVTTPPQVVTPVSGAGDAGVTRGGDIPMSEGGDIAMSPEPSGTVIREREGARAREDDLPEVEGVGPSTVRRVRDALAKNLCDTKPRPVGEWFDLFDLAVMQSITEALAFVDWSIKTMRATGATVQYARHVASLIQPWIDNHSYRHRGKAAS